MVHNHQRKIPPRLSAFDRFHKRITRELRLPPDAASVCFLTDTEMERLNTTYRKKRKTTDVLSFPSEERSRPARLRSRAKSLSRESRPAWITPLSRRNNYSSPPLLK